MNSAKQGKYPCPEHEPAQLTDPGHPVADGGRSRHDPQAAGGNHVARRQAGRPLSLLAMAYGTPCDGVPKLGIDHISPLQNAHAAPEVGAHASFEGAEFKADRP